MAYSTIPVGPKDTLQSGGQQPIVLARLPHVGKIPAAPVAAQAVPPPEAMPQLDLRTEIEQHTRQHLAATPALGETPATSHYVDRHHPADPTRSRSVATPPSRTSRSRQSSQRRPTAAKPATFTEKLAQLHSQLAPHAGLIVALALIASAGLLYWMIVGPAQVPVPHYENYGTGIGDEGYGDASGSMPNDYLPQFVANPQQQPASPKSLESWQQPVREETAHEYSKPEFVVELPAAEEPSDSPYPQTAQPQELDFSKVSTLPAPSMSASAPRPLPSVARRPAASNNR